MRLASATPHRPLAARLALVLLLAACDSGRQPPTAAPSPLTSRIARSAIDAAPCNEPLRDGILYASDEFGYSDLMTVRVTGGARTRLTADGMGYFQPALSADGCKVAFLSTDHRRSLGLFVVNVDGTGLRRLTETMGGGEAAWSPDGTRIAFRRIVAPPGNLPSRIFVINADGTGLRQLTPDTPGFSVDGSPSWSPDGMKILFIRLEGSGPELNVINADGTAIVKIRPAGSSRLTSAAWSPDGTRIAATGYSGIPGDYSQDLYVMRADGTGATRITDDGRQLSTPRWSPDGRRIAFVRVMDGLFQLVAVGVTGQNETGLGSGQGHEALGSWTPESQRGER
ncbi:MAG: hypothetical protein NVS1B4_20890 [Gemmatimonadaceae bacterium]